MEKIKTLYKKDPQDLGRVIDDLNKGMEWVAFNSIPTRKFDGTSCAIIGGELYKRFDAKVNKKTGERKPIPEGAIPCQAPDEKTGHWPHWVKCSRDSRADKYHFEAFDRKEDDLIDGTYELVGPKINGNKEGFDSHVLIGHGVEVVSINNLSFESLRSFLSDPENNIEGIVFHEKNGDRMCKIRKSDFGINRNLNKPQ